jgi:hypothetical protein
MWGGTSSNFGRAEMLATKARRPANFASEIRMRQLSTGPLPCFLEVLILRDFKSFAPEVLILGDFKSLFPEVLILVELKSTRMKRIREVGKFSEVLILGNLKGAKCANGWILMGEIVNGRAGRASRAAGRFNDEGVRSRDTRDGSTNGNIMSILSMSYSNRMGEDSVPLPADRGG